MPQPFLPSLSARARPAWPSSRRFRLVKARVRNLNVSRVPHGVVEHGEQLARELFDLYQPQILVLEQPTYPGSRRSRHLPAMIKAIRALARQRGITVVEYTPPAIQAALAPTGTRWTIAALCQAIAQHYPALARYVPKLRRGIGDTEPYYTPLFKAVALGLTWRTQQRRTRSARPSHPG